MLLAHGSGGVLTSQLIEQLVLPAFHNPALDALDDQAVLALSPAAGGARIAFTTDSYVVTPLFFPGGDIGELAVNGTINDLADGRRPPARAVAGVHPGGGARARRAQRVIASAFGTAAARAGVPIVTGDTKVVGRGNGDKIFINTSGVGVVPAGVDAVVAARAPGRRDPAVGRRSAITARPSWPRARGWSWGATCAATPLRCTSWRRPSSAACPDMHAMRDPTRGGLAACWSRSRRARKLGMEVDERAIPVQRHRARRLRALRARPAVARQRGQAGGVRARRQAPARLWPRMRAHPLGRDAVAIGDVTDDGSGLVSLRTPIGGRSILDLPYAEPLPQDLLSEISQRE